MRFAWALPMLLGTILPAAAVKDYQAAETIRVMFERPSVILERLRSQPAPGGTAKPDADAGKQGWIIPAGITKLEADDITNRIIVTGEQTAIKELKELVMLLDVKQRQVLLELKITRYTLDKDGNRDSREFSKPMITTLNNIPASVSVGDSNRGYTLALTPRINGDRSVSVRSELTINDGKDSPARKATGHRRLPGDKSSFLVALTDSKDPVVQSQVEQGQLPVAGGPLTVYYVELKPVVDPDLRRDAYKPK